MSTPRTGTRTRAVYDKLQDGNEHRWSELFNVYRTALWPNSNKDYVSLNLSRILKKYAKRIRRGVYVTKENQVEVLRHGGPEPKMDDICQTCSQPYGNHYGSTWPSPTDCPVVERDGHIRRTSEREMRRYWSSAPKVAHNPFAHVLEEYKAKGSPEIEDMPWTYKNDAQIDHETEVAMLEARIEDLERTKLKRLEPHGFPTCTCGHHTWPHLIDDPSDAPILEKVRKQLLSDDGYGVGHYSDRICKTQPFYPNNKPVDIRSDLQKQIEVLEADAKDLRKIIDNKNHYISQTENKLVEIAERSHKRQQLIDETAAENVTYQERMESAKTAIDTARSMLADILVGALNESPRAIEELDAQLTMTYGVLDGTMDP